MTYSKVTNWFLVGSSSDTKPTTYSTGTLFYETDTGNISRYNGSSWTLTSGATKTETLQNKTISTANNTLTSGSAAVGDILRYTGSKYDRLARGSSGQILTAGSSDISWATPTFPQYGYETTPDNAIWGAHAADGASTTYTPYGQLARFTTGSGTAHFDLIASEGLYFNLSSGTTIGGKAGWIDNLSSAAFCMDANIYLKVRFRFNGAGNISRLLLGFSGGSTVPTTDTLVASSSPACLLGCRTSDTNIMAVTNDTSGAATYTDTGVAYTTTGFHTYEVLMASSGTATFKIDGTITNTISTNVPTTGVGMHIHCYLTNSTTTAVTTDMHYDVFRADF